MLSDLEAELRKAFYTPAEVAALADLSPSTILNYIHAGRVKAVQLSERTYRIPRKAVIRLLEPESLHPVESRTEPDAEVDLSEADRDAGLFARA